MKYYLSENDRKTLNQTINTVNNLPTSVRGGKRPTIKNAFAYAELTAQDENGLWSAFEVYFDETGTPNELTDGRVWGLEIPSIIVNGTVSAGTVIRVERYYMVEAGKEQPVWVGSAVGGGNDIRLLMNGAVLEKGVPLGNGGSVVDYDNNIITSNVTIVQNVFDTANIYSGEVLYAYINEDGNYALDKALLGV